MNLAANYGLAASVLLPWAAKATVLLGLAWLVTVCLRTKSAGIRHRVWAIAIVSSLVLPVVSLALPAWHVISRPVMAVQTVSQSPLVVESPAPPITIAQPKRALSTEQLIDAGLFVWAFGTVLVMLRLFAGIARLWRVSAYSKPASESDYAAMDALRMAFGIMRRIRLLESASKTMMPMTWGVLRPRIVVPSNAREWDAERRRIVFSHELAHVVRNDWILQFCAEALRACFWFHPLAWIAARRMRQESERACDDAVLNSGITASEYAGQLLALAQTLKAPNWRFSLALAIARPSNLERRFAAMLSSSISRKPLSRKTNLIAISFGACLLLPLAALTLSAATPTSTPNAAVPAQPGTPVNAQPVATGGGSISGTIVDQRGSGIRGANITLTTRSTRTEQRAATGTNGAFLFSNLTTGTYIVHIARPGLNISPSRNIAVVLHDKAMTATIHLTLSNFRAALAEHASDLVDAAPNTAAAPAAQSGPVGSISGSVGDPSGAMIPRASVTLTDVATHQQQQITAGEVGEFTFSNLIPDSYELSVSQSGFQVYRQPVQLYPSEDLKLPELLLRLGEVSQVVTVSASRTAPPSGQVPAAPSGLVLACSVNTTQAAPLTPKNPVQAGPPPNRIRVGGMAEMARLTEQSLPIYPESARAAGVQGTVVFDAVIGKDGSLLSPCLVNSQVDPVLVQSAMAAISRWRYSPTLLNGEPVEVVTQIAVVYSLTN